MAKKINNEQASAPKYENRFGIGEWYGEPFAEMPQAKRVQLAQIARQHKESSGQTPVANLPDCPFVSSPTKRVPCWKKGGICTLQKVRRPRIVKGQESTPVELIEGIEGSLRIVCPTRFQQDNFIFQWVGKEVLQSASPEWVTSVDFLTRLKAYVDEDRPKGQAAAGGTEKEVGSIDAVLVKPGTDPLQWCALEIQAVYFSGERMSHLFTHVAQWDSPGIPFPDRTRRPDYRSSGAKRLMPQLQTKVPTLRRWGKKMAVVVDEAFFENLGDIRSVPDISNCDIAWFVIGVENKGLVCKKLVLTTLEHTVEGLTNGQPVTLDQFETQVREKLERVKKMGEVPVVTEPTTDLD